MRQSAARPSWASMGLRVEQLDGDVEAWWDGLVRRVPEGSIFQSVAWARYLRDYYHYDPTFLIVRDRGPDPLGCLLAFRGAYCHEWLFHKRLGRSAVSVMKRLVPEYHWLYGPLVMPEGNDGRADIAAALVEHVCRLARERDGAGIESFAYPIHDLASPASYRSAHRPLDGLQSRRAATRLLDLAQEIEHVWKGLRGSVRTAVRYALREGVGVESIRTFEELKAYHEFASACTRGRPDLLFPGPLRHYEAIWSTLCRAGQAKFFVAKRQGRGLAGLGVRAFNGIVSVFDLVQSPDPDDRRLCGNYALLWSVIEWAKSEGFRLCDLAGVAAHPGTEKERRIRFFKERWGGRLVEYDTMTWRRRSGRVHWVRSLRSRWTVA